MASFSDRIEHYRKRVESFMEAAIPAAALAPESLHAAMRYSVLNGGKRVRPLLVYAAGECAGVAPERLDPAAAAVELIHAFSLIHDDLPAMDDDDLRRGRPTVHRAFDEATAILAGDALLPLAFGVISGSDALGDGHKIALSRLLADASGSLGMTGGQAIDLASEGKRLDERELERMHRLKTGALIHASVVAAYCVGDGLGETRRAAFERYGKDIGLAFQIRDDLLDVEGDTDEIGKQTGSDAAHHKATWPSLFGIDESRRRCDELLQSAIDALAAFGDSGEPLRWIADYIVARRS